MSKACSKSLANLFAAVGWEWARVVFVPLHQATNAKRQPCRNSLDCCDSRHRVSRLMLNGGSSQIRCAWPSFTMARRRRRHCRCLGAAAKVHHAHGVAQQSAIHGRRDRGLGVYVCHRRCDVLDSEDGYALGVGRTRRIRVVCQCLGFRETKLVGRR